MTTIKRKLKSKNGASIIFAMVFFMMCMTIGGITLASASTSAGRLLETEKVQEGYMSASSAAKVIRDEIIGQKYKVKITETEVYENDVLIETGADAPTKVVDKTEPEKALGEKLNVWADYLYEKSIYDSTSGGSEPTIDDINKKLTIAETAGSEKLKPIVATFEMDEEYGIEVDIVLADNSYALKLLISAEQISTRQPDEIEEETRIEIVGDEEIEIIKRTVTKVTEFEVGWKEAKILKASPPKPEPEPPVGGEGD